MGIDLHAACRSTPVARHSEGQLNKLLLVFQSTTAEEFDDRGDPLGATVTTLGWANVWLARRPEGQANA